MADYAISNVPRRVVYAASGTGPYAFTFEILSQTDIAVYKASTLLTLTTDYTVTINANGTGSVTLVVTAGADNITIVGAKNIQRTTDFTTGGDLFANTLNDELDNQTIFIQQVAETAERGLKAPVTDPTDIAMNLPAKADRASKYLAFDANGNPIATAGTSEPVSFGTMSTQNANAVAITGGTITGITDLAVADGGTGASTFTSDAVLLGNGTSAFQTVAPSTNGNVLTSNGTTWISAAAPGGFSAGTVLLFYQAAAPTGWTKVTTQNDKALRVVSGTGGGTGGSVAFTTAFASQSVNGTVGTTGATTLSTSQIPSHTHSTPRFTGDGVNSGYDIAGAATVEANNTGATGGGGSHDHSGGTFTGTAINLAVQYIDIIICSKD
jgi:hypothetical protein